jgi:hypothetical protein
MEMSAKTRLNKELIFGTILQNLAGVGLACVMLGAVGYMMWITDYSSNEDVRRPALYEFNTIANDPGSYRLSGPDQFVSRQGDYMYTFNFESQQVLIDGNKNLQPINFRDFSNPAMIEDMKEKGCILSANFVTAANAYLNGGERTESNIQHTNSDRAIAQSYVDEHCPAARMVPHVR